MHTVFFDTIDTYKDLGLILKEKSIEAPKIKDNYVDIDGADGSIDLTEVFGAVRYEDRDISLTFYSIKNPNQFLQEFSHCQNLLHGRRFKIVFDDDEDFYYIGRVSIDKWKIDKVVGSFSVDITAEPWKYWRDETVIKETISESKTIRLFNLRKPVIPTFVTSESMSLIFGEKTVISPRAEEFYSADIQLSEGDNWLKVTGAGEITIRYQMGSL